MEVTEHPHYRRGMVLLSRIHSPEDLITIWRLVGTIQFGGPAIECTEPLLWWDGLFE